MPRGKVKESTSGGDGFKLADIVDKLVAIKLIELTEVVNKYFRAEKKIDQDNSPRKPAVVVRICEIEPDGTARTLTTRIPLSNQVIVNQFSELDPEMWYTGRFLKPKAAYFWQNNDDDEENLCDKAVELLESTDSAVETVKEVFEEQPF